MSTAEQAPTIEPVGIFERREILGIVAGNERHTVTAELVRFDHELWMLDGLAEELKDGDCCPDHGCAPHVTQAWALHVHGDALEWCPAEEGQVSDMPPAYLVEWGELVADIANDEEEQ